MTQFSLKELYKIIKKRVRLKDPLSYSYKVYKNPKLLNGKILEEAKELTKTKNKKQVIWETSDLLYFTTLFLVKRKVTFKDVENKLMERNKNRKKLTKSLKEEIKKQK